MRVALAGGVEFGVREQGCGAEVLVEDAEEDDGEGGEEGVELAVGSNKVSLFTIL